MQANPLLPSSEIPNISRVLLVAVAEEEAQRWLSLLSDAGWHGKADILTNPALIGDRCHKTLYQAILLDQCHPALNPSLTGELLRRLNGHPPVVLIMGEPNDPEALHGLALGAYDYVFRSCLSRLPVATLRAIEATDLRIDLAGTDDQLKEVEDRFHWLADFVQEGAVIEGADGILQANPAFAELVRAGSPLEALGKSLFSCLSAESREKLQSALQANSLAPEPIQLDVVINRLDGTQAEAALSAVGIGFHGQAARLFVLRDRQEKRRVEAALIHLADFARENPNPILMFSCDGRLTYHNAAAMELARSFGREHPAACVPAQATSIVESCLVSGQGRSRVIWEQNDRTFSWSFFPHVESGVVHAFVVEITDQRKLEEQLRYSQRLEGVGRLAGGVAHEYFNLLTVMQGQLDLLRSAEELTPKGRETLQQVLHAVDRAEQLTRQLLTFSRRNQVQLGALDVNAIVNGLSDLLSRTLGDDIALTFEPSPNLPEILGDRPLLEQVIVNLAVNARDAMPEGGQLMITTSEAQLTNGRLPKHPESRAGRFIRLTFTDTGCGIDPRLLPYLFEPFVTTKTASSVNGLGLSTAYGIVKQHNGWIEVLSQRGAGSTFRIFLPVGPSWAATPTDALTSPSLIIPAETPVLLVEDEPAVRYTLKSMLEHEGYRVLEAASGLEALAVWRENSSRIRVLLTDLVLPSGISGSELAQHVLETHPRLRVIYTSGYGVDSVGRGLPLEAGVNFLQKPFHSRDFTHALERQASEISHSG
ncbi:MAG: response regulator [Verrucomicrobia bacterium]|nr:response regulator [Verrucomicrobiota bacterium]